MARKKTKYTGIYTDKLKTGINYYARFDIHRKTNWVNLTKEYGVHGLSEAKVKYGELLGIAHNPTALYVTKKLLVNDLLEDFINIKNTDTAGRAKNRTYHHNLELLYEKNLKDIFEYVKISNVKKSHFDTIKKELDTRGVGQSTFSRIRSLVNSAIGDYIDLKPLLKDFKAEKINTENRKLKLPITYIINEDLETALQKIYSYYQNLRKPDHKYLSLFQLLTARRIGETVLYRYEHFDPTDNTILTTPEVTKSSVVEKVFVPDEVAQYIKDKMAKGYSKKDKIFPVPLGTIDYYIKKAYDTVKIKVNQSIGAHISRDLLSTILASRGVKTSLIEKLLSHKPSTVTAIHYLSILEGQLKETLVYYERIAKGVESKNDSIFVLSKEPVN